MGGRPPSFLETASAPHIHRGGRPCIVPIHGRGGTLQSPKAVIPGPAHSGLAARGRLRGRGIQPRRARILTRQPGPTRGHTIIPRCRWRIAPDVAAGGRRVETPSSNPKADSSVARPVRGQGRWRACAPSESQSGASGGWQAESAHVAALRTSYDGRNERGAGGRSFSAGSVPFSSPVPSPGAIQAAAQRPSAASRAACRSGSRRSGAASPSGAARSWGGSPSMARSKIWSMRST